MNPSALKVIAGALGDTGAPGLPTVLLMRETLVYEVEFAALEFAEEAKLSSCDWATLALARALGEISPAEVDAYLGLGEAVSEGIVRRLLGEALLEEPSSARRSDSLSPDGIVTGFWRRFFTAASPPVEETVAPSAPPRTEGRKLRESHASATPVCRLSAGGAKALELGAVARRRVRPARLLFLADPLLFLGIVDEKRHRHTQHRRPRPLEPDRVPPALRTLDATFALPASERLQACGIETGIRGLSGQFLGVVPGAQWEVRKAERSGPEGREQQSARIMLAGYPSSETESLHWCSYLRWAEQTQGYPHVDACRVLGQDPPSLNRFLATLKAEVPLPLQEALRSDGAFELRCDGPLLSRLLGGADRPDDTYLPAHMSDWEVGLLAHPVPLDIEASHDAFYELLRRRDATLRKDFDRTCSDVKSELISYWGENPGLPSVDEAAVRLWSEPEFRAALCMRRRHRDLVAPYETTEVAQ